VLDCGKGSIAWQLFDHIRYNMFDILDYLTFYLIPPVILHPSKPKAEHEKLLKQKFHT
jgi:hypothetical protein